MAETETKKDKNKRTRVGSKRPESRENGTDEARTDTWTARAQLAVVIALIIAAVILSQVMRQNDAPRQTGTLTQPLLVETVSVSPSAESISFSRTGTVTVRAFVNIVPQVSGKVVDVSQSFRNGAVFEKGEPLFVIEQADYRNQLDMAQAEVERAETVLALAEAETEAARAEWAGLHPDKTVPDLVARLPQLKEARASLKAARARLSDAELAYKRTVFRMPYGGRVVEAGLEVGQVVTAGQSYGRVYPENSLEVIVPVEDRVLKWIDAGSDNAAHITTDYRGRNIILEGMVERIGGQLDEDTRFVTLVISPRGDDWEKLLPGVFVDVTLTGPVMDNIWVLPNAVLQGQQGVWIVKDDRTLRYFEPEILSVREDTTLAVGSGEAVTLVKGLVKGAAEGMKIRIVDEESVPAGDLRRDEGYKDTIDKPRNRKQEGAQTP